MALCERSKLKRLQLISFDVYGRSHKGLPLRYRGFLCPLHLRQVQFQLNTYLLSAGAEQWLVFLGEEIENQRRRPKKVAAGSCVYLLHGSLKRPLSIPFHALVPLAETAVATETAFVGGVSIPLSFVVETALGSLGRSELLITKAKSIQHIENACKKYQRYCVHSAVGFSMHSKAMKALTFNQGQWYKRSLESHH